MVATLSATQSPVSPSITATPQVTVANTAATTTTTTAAPAAPTQNFSAGNVYVEDLLGQQTASAVISKFPISFWQNRSVNDEPSGVFTGQFNRDQSIVGAIWRQATDSNSASVTTSYAVIKLTIRGDPYWLGQSNLHRQINLTVGNLNVSKNDLPDWVTGSQAIFVYFRYPYTTGDDFKPNMKSSTIFSGVYKVNTITHFFAEGEFKQELTCTIDPLSDVSLWAAQTDNSAPPPPSKAASPPATPPPPATPTTQQPPPASINPSNFISPPFTGF